MPYGAGKWSNHDTAPLAASGVKISVSIKNFGVHEQRHIHEGDRDLSEHEQ